MLPPAPRRAPRSPSWPASTPPARPPWQRRNSPSEPQQPPPLPASASARSHGSARLRPALIGRLQDVTHARWKARCGQRPMKRPGAARGRGEGRVVFDAEFSPLESCAATLQSRRLSLAQSPQWAVPTVRLSGCWCGGSVAMVRSAGRGGLCRCPNASAQR